MMRLSTIAAAIAGVIPALVSAIPTISIKGAKFFTSDGAQFYRSEEHTSELQSQSNLVCRLLLEKKKSMYHFTLILDLFLVVDEIRDLLAAAADHVDVFVVT